MATSLGDVSAAATAAAPAAAGGGGGGGGGGSSGAAAGGGGGGSGGAGAGAARTVPRVVRGPIDSPVLEFSSLPPSSAATVVAEALDERGIMDPVSAGEFGDLVAQYMLHKNAKPPLDWKKIEPPTPGILVPYSSLEPCPADDALHHELLQKIAVVKLNGGLGTRMGCRGPKSAIEVRSDLTFLDLTVRHVEYLNTRWGVDVPLVLMDSFQTHEETVRIVRKYAEHNLTIHCFTQSSYPKLLRDSLTPLPTGPFSLETKDLWYPPGHGDIYRALYKSGVLDSLLREGKEWLFVSNVDNTGATVDLNLVYHLVNHDAEFCMEVTQKTRSDVHGGTLISYEGRPKLLEAAQVPAEHEPEFRSLKRFTAFNTNNLWVSARAVKRLVEADAIRSAVVVNFREWAGRAIVELESAAGGAIECFGKAIGVEVDRSRFLPVKSTSDLLAIQSDLYTVRHGALEANPAREVPTPPVIKLGPEFHLLSDYSVRFAAGIPNMLELDHLTISGDVYFGRGVTLRGTVIIVANEGSRIDIPDGAVLENKVVTGHLRILEH